MPTNKLSLMDRVARFVGTELFPVAKDGKTVAGTAQALAEFVAPIAAQLAPVSEAAAASAAAALEKAGEAAASASDSAGHAGVSTAQADIATVKASAAADSAAVALVAENAAMAAGRLYQTIALGLAASVEGQSFSVPALDGNSIIAYRVQNGAASAPLASFPTKAYVDSGIDFTSYARSGYVGAIVDSLKRIALGVRKTGQIDIGNVQDVGGKVSLNTSIATGPASGASSVVATPSGSARTNPRLTSDVTALQALPANVMLAQGRSNYAWPWTDNQNRVAGGLDYAGNLWTKGVNATSVLASINAAGVSNLVSAATLANILYTATGYARSGYAWALTDSAGKVAFGVDRAGNLISKGLSVNARISALEAEQGTAPAYDKAINGYSTFVGWGDSLSAGAGGNGTTYLTALATLSGRSCYNGGVGGQASADIATRQGGFVTLLTVTGNTIPASGGVAVTATTRTPITSQGGNNISGRLAGVQGTLSATFDGNGSRTSMTFTRATAGTAVVIDPATPFIPDTFDRDYQIPIFWYGRNNFPTGVSDFVTAKQNVKDALAASIAFLKPLNKKFVVLGVINRNVAAEYIGQPVYQAIVDLNEELKALYPRNFIDIRRVLVRAYDPNSATDVTDFGNDIPPTSLSSDGLHLNAAGYTLVGQTVYNFVQQKGW